MVYRQKDGLIDIRYIPAGIHVFITALLSLKLLFRRYILLDIYPSADGIPSL